MTALGAERYALIAAKLAETLNQNTIAGQSTQDFNRSVKEFSRYVAQLSADPKAD